MRHSYHYFMISKLSRELAAVTHGPDRDSVSLRQTIVTLRPEILRLRELGHSWGEIARKLKGMGMEIKPNTLKNYALRATKAGRR